MSNGFRYQVSDPLKALDVANRLYESGRVEYSYPGWIKEHRLNFEPDDTYFGDQWHLKNTGQYGGNAGEDGNIFYTGTDGKITSIWDTLDLNGNPIQGSGVMIAIVDDGVEIAHEDLQPNTGKKELNYSDPK